MIRRVVADNSCANTLPARTRYRPDSNVKQQLGPQHPGRCSFAISRHGLPELCISFALQELRGRREDRVRAAPAVPCARSGGDAHTSIQVRRKHPGLPCAMALRLTSCSPRSGRARCHRRPREAFASLGLDASIGASGPHDFAVRFRRATSLAPSASIASHRAFVTFASAPHPAAMTGGVMPLICPTG